MIICVCNRLREQQILETAQKVQASSVKDLYHCMGCKVQCGKCTEYVQEEILKVGCHN